MKHLFVCENCGKIFMASTDGTIRNCCGHDMCSDKCANEFMNGKEANVEMNENYIVINGKKTELTEEQVKALGIAVGKNPFATETERYVCTIVEPASTDVILNRPSLNDAVLAFNNRDFAYQVALHQLLYRKLLKFIYDNGYVDMAEWNGGNPHWYITYATDIKDFVVGEDFVFKAHSIYFSSEEAAECAIHEVIEPFMKKYPEFKW